jgi:hypothetical protein
VRRDDKVRGDERHQQYEQDGEQEALVEVPEEEEQVGEAHGGDQAAHVQEVHATSKARRGGRGEPPTSLPQEGESGVGRLRAVSQKGDVGEFERGAAMIETA